ncbi:hypothetical protein OCH239_12760 [Roseivivax halodurans JCM 10272]|uniref:Uncharacterized protein n=1 Tax=Roseivivax halodurans JCM 10272 TaxID=1449350 RepID=X7EDN8_9RHOB|nr:hypothetical protein OCH239_12760 [Roseivivax halodurans JCM 10272]
MQPHTDDTFFAIGETVLVEIGDKLVEIGAHRRSLLRRHGNRHRLELERDTFGRNARKMPAYLLNERPEIHRLMLIGLIELLMQVSERVDTRSHHRQRQLGILRREGPTLQADEGRERLKGVLDPVVDFPAEHIGGAKGSPGLEKHHDLAG